MTVLAAAIVLASACDKVPLLAPVESTVTLSVNTTTLPINGTAELLATVIEPAGTPVHNGTLVTFTSSVGVVEPRDARTENGTARATFRAGTQSATAVINAFSGSARAEPVEVLVGGAAATTVSVRAEPSTVPSTGGTVQIIAVVIDVSGNPLPGAPVVFSADNGSLSATSILSDANGEARTSLTTTRETVVTARVAAMTGTVTVRAINPPAVTITISANPLVGAPVTFTIAAPATGNVITQAVIDFGDGSPTESLGVIPPGGSAATVHRYQRADAYVVRVTSTDSSGIQGTSTTVVNVTRATPTLTMSVSPLTPAPIVGTTLTVTITISNPQAIPVRSLVVTFGDGTQSSLATPQTGFVSTQKAYSAAGTYRIRAELTDANGGISSAEQSVTVGS
jgi:Bacterial Ig-like domain (group 1)/PKD domain